jgi:hypothetical protein
MIGARLRRRLRGYLAPLEIELGGDHQGGSGTNITTSALSYGATAKAGRRMFALIVGTRQAATRTLNSCSIGGVSATIHQQRFDNVNNNPSGGIWAMTAVASAIVPTGTSGAVNCNWSGALDALDVVLVGVNGLLGSSPLDVQDTGVTSGFASVSMTTVKRSLIVAACGFTNATPSFVNLDGIGGRLISLNRVTAFGWNIAPSYPSMTVGIGSGRANIVAVSWK